MENKFTCVICGEAGEGFGNNPSPVRNDGKCCAICNEKFVIPERLKRLSFVNDNAKGKVNI